MDLRPVVTLGFARRVYVRVCVCGWVFGCVCVRTYVRTERGAPRFAPGDVYGFQAGRTKIPKPTEESVAAKL